MTSPERTEEASARPDLPDWALSPEARAARAAQAGKLNRLEIGDVFYQTFGAIGANFGSFFLLSVLLAALPSLVLNFGWLYLIQALVQSGDVFSYNNLAIFAPLLIGLILIVPSYILIGALTHGAIVYFNKGRASFGECLATGLRNVLPLIGLGFIAALGYILWGILAVLPSGFLGASGVADPLIVFPVTFVFAIPLIMAAIRWSVSAPSLVVEHTGVFGAFRRSGDLTRGNRWMVFWIAVIYVVLTFLIQLGVTFIIGALIGILGDPSLLIWMSAGTTAVYSALNNMIGGAGSAALYYELRVIKDGATSDQLAKVFE